VATPRHIIVVGPSPDRLTMRGLTSLNGRPLLSLEEGARGTVRIDFDAALDPDAELVGLQVGAQGCKACAAFTERQAEVYVEGSQPWGYGAGQGYDYGFDNGAAQGVQILARLSTGDDVALRIYVRAPNKLRDWRSRFGSGSPVIDQRSRPIYTDEPILERLLPCGASFSDGQVYRVSEFGAGFGEGFSS
jgi:hypothetical protein